jgi:hypothetical protein
VRAGTRRCPSSIAMPSVRASSSRRWSWSRAWRRFATRMCEHTLTGMSGSRWRRRRQRSRGRRSFVAHKRLILRRDLGPSDAHAHLVVGPNPEEMVAAQPAAITIGRCNANWTGSLATTTPSGRTARWHEAPAPRPTPLDPKPSSPVSRSPPTTGSATTPSTPAAPSPCATTADSTTSDSAPPASAPASPCSSTACTSASSAATPAN